MTYSSSKMLGRIFAVAVYLNYASFTLGLQIAAETTVRNYNLVRYNVFVNYSQAVENCKLTDSWLVEIKDEGIETAVESIRTGNTWIGGSYDDAWKWNDGEKMIYTNWGFAPSTTTTQCTISRSKWHTINCGLVYNYICQSDLTFAGNYNFTFHSGSFSSVSFDDANETCSFNGSSLVKIKTKGVQSHINKQINGTSDYYWTSGSDLDTEGQWRWGDGTSLSLNAWATNEPGNNDDCLAVSGLQWYGFNCFSNHFFICQKDVSSGECSEKICSNRGTCERVDQRYNCTCDAGYFGTKCEKDLVELSITQSALSTPKGSIIGVQVTVKTYEDVQVTAKKEGSEKSIDSKSVLSGTGGVATLVTLDLGEQSQDATYYIIAVPSVDSALYQRNLTVTVTATDGPCERSICANNAACRNTLTAPNYQCTCTPAYEGNECQNEKFVGSGSCKYHINFEKKVQFSAANATCANINGILAIVKSQSTQSKLESLVQSLYGDDDALSLWIGGYKHGNLWLWGDGVIIGSHGTFSGWAPNYPTSSGNRVAMTSSLSIAGKKTWTKLDWVDARETVSNKGFICEKKVGSGCYGGYCRNGGTCEDIGCQKICHCTDAYGGLRCETEYMKVVPDKSSYYIYPGKTLKIPVEITSVDGPATVTVTDQNANVLSTKTNAASSIEFDLGPFVDTTTTPMTLTFTSSRQSTLRLYKQKSVVRIYFYATPFPSGISIGFCGNNADVNVSVTSSAVGIKHRIFLVKPGYKNGDTRYVTPTEGNKFPLKYINLETYTTYNVEVTVCPDCTSPSKRTYSFKTPDRVPRQPIHYLLVVHKDTENTCSLKWATVNICINSFKIYTDIREISSTAVNKSEVTSVPGNTTNFSYTVAKNKNYSFSIRAYTCDGGVGDVLTGIGPCVTTIINESQSSTGDQVAEAVLAVFFILALVAIAAMLFIWYRKYRNAGQQNDSAKKKSVKPYQTTYFEGDNNTTITGKNNGYEVPINFRENGDQPHSGYENAIVDDEVKSVDYEDIYRYENFSESPQQSAQNATEQAAQPPTPKQIMTPGKVTTIAERTKAFDQTTAKAVQKPIKLPTPKLQPSTNIAPTTRSPQAAKMPNLHLEEAISKLKPTPAGQRPKIALKPGKKV